MRTLSDNHRIIKFADDTLSSLNQPSQLQNIVDEISSWCRNHNLLIEPLRPRYSPSEMTLSLSSNFISVEPVGDCSYLGTILTSKLKLTNNTNLVVKIIPK